MQKMKLLRHFSFCFRKKLKKALRDTGINFLLKKTFSVAATAFPKRLVNLNSTGFDIWMMFSSFDIILQFFFVLWHSGNYISYLLAVKWTVTQYFINLHHSRIRMRKDAMIKVFTVLNFNSDDNKSLNIYVSVVKYILTSPVQTLNKRLCLIMWTALYFL